MIVASTHKRLVLLGGAAIACWCAGVSTAAPQPSTVEKAQALSEQTGRPILAVVTNDKCTPCKALIERLGTTAVLKQWASAFVPLTIDDGTADWQKWRTKYPPEGKTLPLIYIIRADGEMLFGKSTDQKPEDEFLIALMRQQLAKSGRWFTNQQAQSLAAAVQEAKQARVEGDDDTAVKVLITASKAADIGPLGKVGGYSTTASDANKLYDELVETGTTRINESKDLLLEGGADAFFAALNLAEAVRTYSVLPELRALGGRAVREVKRNDKASEHYTQALQVDKAVSLAEHNKLSASRELKKLAERYAGTPAGEEARRRYEEFSGKPLKDSDVQDTGHDSAEQEVRVWTDLTGKFRVRASLVQVAGDIVKLRKPDGTVIDVPRDKLSEADQEFLAQ